MPMLLCGWPCTLFHIERIRPQPGSFASPRIRPVILEAFTIIQQPPDLQVWIFGHGLEDDALAILAFAIPSLNIISIKNSNRERATNGKGKNLAEGRKATRRTLTSIIIHLAAALRGVDKTQQETTYRSSARGTADHHAAAGREMDRTTANACPNDLMPPAGGSRPPCRIPILASGKTQVGGLYLPNKLDIRTKGQCKWPEINPRDKGQCKGPRSSTSGVPRSQPKPETHQPGGLFETESETEVGSPPFDVKNLTLELFLTHDLPCTFLIDPDSGVLKQAYPDGKTYTVQHFSRSLRAHERSYSNLELQCLAIVESVDNFRALVERDQSPVRQIVSVEIKAVKIRI
ncbi:hypothetical protein LAZ67_X001974 [Cordylochernes scorpioides]|uniref:Reverse transcriptase/retrotransposon-derived protein RNase H-like domain-containing protein n=1 Tax=Cordylochernes scorpioides TaxID=51811 RepID=A0ABY6LTG3_9ARAC|nr:hypothetical protein LAZ67_X001974 [Cordylochernes scorpioides]